MTTLIRPARVLCLVSLVALILACGGTGDPPYKTNVQGIDRRNFDTTCAPCDDFYQFANGGWIANNPIPEEFGSYGTAHEIYERNNLIFRKILDEVSSGRQEPGSVAQKIGDYYAAGMDTATINRLGLTPLQEDFDRIEAIASLSDFCHVVSGLHARGTAMLFDTDVLEDFTNTSVVNLFAVQGGLGLPERGYYFRDDETSSQLRDQYVEYIGNMFRLLGDDDTVAEKNADIVMGIEMRLAEASLSQTEIRNFPAWYLVPTIDELYQYAPDFDWRGHMVALGLEDIDRISFGPARFFEGLNKALNEEPLENWKQYARFHLINSSSFLVGEKFDKENFRFYGTILGGSKERQDRWKRILGSINGAMGHAMGQLFVERAFPPETKERAMAMVANLKIALRERLDNLSWMTDATRQKALAKLDAFTEKIGYPDHWRDFSDLEIGRNSFAENALAAARFNMAFELEKVGAAPDPAEWVTNAQTINAYYNPLKNELLFPAGIMQPPLFDGGIDDAVNYGAMGVIMGHEMLHGFDDSGSRFDAAGNMRNWWTEADRTEFENRTAGLVEMFDAFTVADSVHVNGHLTLGENIADLGGLRIAYRALQLAREGREDPMVDGLSQEQRFFLSFAQFFRKNVTREAILLQVQSDPHSPAQYRVNGPLSNLAEFAEAWGCGESSNMVRPADKRIQIW